MANNDESHEHNMTTFNNLLDDFADLCFASREREREWTAIPAAIKLEEASEIYRADTDSRAVKQLFSSAT